MVFDLTLRVKNKNAAINEYMDAKDKCSAKITLLKPIVKGVRVELYDLTEALDELVKLMDELESNFIDMGHIPLDGDSWDEESLSEWIWFQRLEKFKAKLVRDPKLIIPEEFSGEIPTPGTDEFLDYIDEISNEIYYETDLCDELSNSRGRINDWLLSYSDWMDCIIQFYDYPEISETPAVTKKCVG